MDTLDGKFMFILKTRNIFRIEVEKFLGNSPLGRQRKWMTKVRNLLKYVVRMEARWNWLRTMLTSRLWCKGFELFGLDTIELVISQLFQLCNVWVTVYLVGQYLQSSWWQQVWAFQARHGCLHQRPLCCCSGI